MPLLRASTSRLLIHAATLEYLRRGGRIGRAQSMIGDVFGIRPLVATVRGADRLCQGARRATKAKSAMGGYLEKYCLPDDEMYFVTLDAINAEPSSRSARGARAAAAQRRDYVVRGRGRRGGHAHRPRRRRVRV